MRIYYGIEVGTELSGIDPGGSTRGIGYGRARHEAMPPNGAQLSYWRAIAAHDNGPSSFYLTEYCAGLIAQFALGDGTALHANHCSIRSTL